MSLYRIPEELLNETIHDVINYNSSDGSLSVSPTRGTRGTKPFNDLGVYHGLSTYGKDRLIPSINNAKYIKRTIQELRNRKKGEPYEDDFIYPDGRY